MQPFEFHARTRVVFGIGEVSRVGELAAALGTRALLVADPGIVEAGYATRVQRLLESAGIGVVEFHDFGENPDSRSVERGRDVAAPARVDVIVAVGGGSSLDCAKGVNFLLGGGGTVSDYRGYGKARGAMQLGAFYAGLAIEHSMLGATHACANPLTQHYGTTHGVAIALLLPHVVRWNSRVAADRYAELAAVRGETRRPETLLARLEDFIAAGEFPGSLASAGVPERDLPQLAAAASEQWTGRFNPRPFDVAGALEIYAAAY
jgi:alcohol dehydrogenase class IV